MNGPTFLRSAGDLEVVIGWYAPTFVGDNERAIFYDGRRGYVSHDTFEWIKTADPAELGAVRVIRIETTPPEWLTRPKRSEQNE